MHRVDWLMSVLVIEIATPRVHTQQFKRNFTLVPKVTRGAPFNAVSSVPENIEKYNISFERKWSIFVFVCAVRLIDKERRKC